MLLQKEELRCMNAAAHEGKLVVIATDSAGHLWYTVKQDGFEDSYLNSDPAKRTGWEPWTALELPDEADDTSVIAREQATLTREDVPGVHLLRSQYRSKDLGAVAPAQLVSGSGHLYIFRQSKTGTLLCDRFVLDGMTNKLGRKLDVRFKRSRKRHTPFNPGKAGPALADSLDFRDTSGAFFHEPTTELCLVSGVTDGWFSVVRVATDEHERFRWHIFSYNATSKKIDAVSIRTSEEGLFDVRDQLSFDSAQTDGSPPIARSIPGILRRSIAVPAAVITSGPAATSYDLQQERLLGTGPAMQLVRTATRLMLAVPTDKGLAAFSFGLATDGSLSEVTQVASASVLRSDERDLMLPLDTLDNIKAAGAVEPPPRGTILGLGVGAEGSVVVASDEAGDLEAGDTVEIRGTTHYNGLYDVVSADDGAFVIQAQFVNDEVGAWEKREAENQPLTFDGMVTSYQRTDDGKLRVFAENHGLSDGDQVQIVGTMGYDGAHPVTSVNADSFLVQRSWTAGEAVNVKLEARKRRGIILDGINDYIDLPPEAFPAGKEITICVWARGGTSLPRDATLIEALDKSNRRIAFVSLPSATGGVYFDCGNGSDGCDRTGKTATTADYKGGWTHWAFTKNTADATSMRIYRNGVPWCSGPGTRALGAAAKLRIGALVIGSPPGSLQLYEGTLADLAIYNRALSADEIKNSIYLTLTGHEPGLMGYFRLGAIVEGETRQVTDVSTNGRDGTVFGGASAGGVTLSRKLRDDTTLAVKYGNPELVAVTQRATYVEEIDFRVMAGGAPLTKAALENVDNSGKPVFQLRHWGKRSRNAEETIALAQQPPQPFQDLGGGWLRASCRITIPDTIALLRSFEIADVRGTWETLDIHRHAIRLVSDAITESSRAESAYLTTLADAGSAMDLKLQTIAVDEATEAQLFAEKLAVEAKLALLADLEYLRTERDAMAKEVDTLTPEVAALEAKYNEEKNNPFNYFCTITLSGAPTEYLHVEGGTGYLRTYGSGPQFEFRLNALNGRYLIRQRNASTAFVYRDANRAREGGFNTQWAATKQTDGYTFQGDDGRYLHREGGTANIVLYSYGHVWKLTPGEASNAVVETSKAAWETRLNALQTAKKRLDELNLLFDPNAPQRPVLEARQKELSNLLVALQSKLATASAGYLDGVKSLQQGALSMPTLATDPRGLATTGALLGFLKPASRLSILETCEGNVQLSYVDAAGRLRVSHYDATSDSRNSAYEQWVTDAGRACLSLTKLGTAANLTTNLLIDDAWSVEAWMITPLPAWEWIFLAGTQDQKNAPLAILNASELGVRSEGRFFGSGFKVDTLPTGWHHVAAVKQGKGRSATVTFHVDGRKVGSAVQPSFSALVLDGTNDAAELPAASLPQGAELTVSFWARSLAQGTPQAVVLEAIDAQSRRLLRVQMTDAAGSIVWECGADAAGLDGLEYKARPAEYQTIWTHWAFTKNANTGLMRVYRNGRPWLRDTGKNRPLTAATKVTVGKAAGADQAFFHGEIADLCIWNKELSATEIEHGLGRPVPEGDARLMGFWKFEGPTAKAKDYSKTAKDGTLLGGPVVLEVVPPVQVALCRVGDTSSIDPPPPLPPLIRPAVQAAIFDIPANTASEKRVELPASAIPTGGAITVCFWARGGSALPKYNSLLEALDASNRRIIGIHMPWVDQVIYWDCGHDGSAGDRINKTATAAEYKDTWAHWAFVKNAATGKMEIYRNGALWHSGTGMVRPIPPVVRVVLGRSVNETAQTYSGEIAELSIWNKALSLAEIVLVRDRLLTGGEAGLMGYWAFGAQGATDLSPAKRHGTYFGGLALTPPVPQPATLFFDGVDDHVALPEMNIDFSGGLTIEAWVWFNAYNNNSRILDFGVGQGADNIVLYNGAGTTNLRLTIFRGGTALHLEAAGQLQTGVWLHLAVTVSAAGVATLYKNGASIASGPLHLPMNVSRAKNYLGRSNWGTDGHFSGKMADVRLWNKPRSQADIQNTMSRRLWGTEPGLVGYWTFGPPAATDLSAGKRNGVYTGGPRLDPGTAPQLALPSAAGAVPQLPPALPPLKLSELRIWGTGLDDFEIEVNSKTLLSGNEPSLLAYLPMNEATGADVRDATGRGNNGTVGAAVRWACGAPIGYLGPSKYDAVVSAEYSAVVMDPATRQKTALMRRFFGSAVQGGVHLLPDKRVEELDVVWIGNAQFAPTLLGYIEGAPPVPSENLTESLSYNGATSVELVTSEDVEYRWNRTEDIGAGLSLDAFVGVDNQMLGGIGVMSNTLEFRAGAKANLDVGFNWTAESNITTRSSNRLTDRLELRGTPEETPKFPRIGKRFIPKNVGYALVISGTADVFVSKLKRSGKMVGYQLSPVDGIPPDVNTITFLMNPAYVMAGSLDGQTGSRPTSDRFHRHVPAMRAQYGALYPASYYRLKEAYSLKQQIENEDKRRESFFAQFTTAGAAFTMDSDIDNAQQAKEVGASQDDGDAQKTQAEQKQADIDRVIGNPSQKAHAETSWKGWQKKMEKLAQIAGKRNIVNTYVWDADGGLRAEQQSFADTAEHTVGGSFSISGGAGLEYGLGSAGAKVELTVLAQGSLTQTLSKTQSKSTGVELNVDLSGVEAIGITNHDDQPILPGEKVDRYRFMTFYLEGSTRNFHDFWSHVVDPEWLRSNGEEARALRQAMGKANKTWRVLHRVTYVERPALMGFGQDVRRDEYPVTDTLLSFLQDLSARQRGLEVEVGKLQGKLDETLALLKK